MWSTYTLVRVGGLPADILPLSPKSVESSFNDLLVVEQKLSKTTDQLIELLYNIIPSITDNTVRRQLLGIKRKVYSGKFISDDQAEVMYSYLADDDISIVFSTWRRCVDDIAEIQKRIDDLCGAHSQEVDSALNSALNNESFMSSLSLASPEFVSYVTSGKEKNKRKKSEALKQQRTLYNYVTRASLKTSPFARLTTVNLAGCTGKGRSVQTISLHLASGLLGLAGQDRRPHPKLVLYPSPQGVVPSAGHERLMLIPHNVHQDGVIYRDETVIGAEWIRDLKPGEIVVIDDKGIQYDSYTDDTQLAICSMEYIYFARPDSNIHGVNVHTARKRMGAQLAREFKHEADIVVGVPNSSLSAAMGFAEESGLPNEMGLIKNQYTQRTFIQPTQELREQGVRMKLSAVSGVVKGKRVVMVDDSIVRGTTSRRIVQLLKEAGASEVHVAIGSPALAYPCFYGIDIQTRQELIAANHTVEETRQIIGADSLTYLSIDGLIDSIGIETDAPNGGLCVAYFDGDYPTPLYDYEEEYRRSLGDKTSFYK